MKTINPQNVCDTLIRTLHDIERYIEKCKTVFSDDELYLSYSYENAAIMVYKAFEEFSLRIMMSCLNHNHSHFEENYSVKFGKQMRNNATASDFYLEKYASPDGLMELLEILSDDRFVDKNEVIEIIKRIHIPGYEEARIYFDEAIAKGVFEPNTKPGFYSQCDIKAVLDYIHDDNR